MGVSGKCGVQGLKALKGWRESLKHLSRHPLREKPQRPRIPAGIAGIKKINQFIYKKDFCVLLTFFIHNVENYKVSLLFFEN